ncbi:hypothetical protein [Leptospira stimsonii]|nr:hypothetical protein [Leptospira stimsonii]
MNFLSNSYGNESNPRFQIFPISEEFLLVREFRVAALMGLT